MGAVVTLAVMVSRFFPGYMSSLLLSYIAPIVSVCLVFMLYEVNPVVHWMAALGIAVFATIPVSYTHLDVYKRQMEESGHRLCYNGDICSAEDLQDRKERFPDLDRVMLGRGLLCNPFLIEMSKTADDVGRKTADDAAHDHMQEKKDRLYAFHQEILEGYIQIMSGDRNVLFRMKELWFYLGDCFTNADKYLKKIKKSERLVAYQAAVDALFHEQELR